MTKGVELQTNRVQERRVLPITKCNLEAIQKKSINAEEKWT